MQRVDLGNGEEWTGTTCPGAVAFDDQTVALALAGFGPLEDWGALPRSGGWGDQPYWWTAAMQELKAALRSVERDQLAREIPHT